MEPPQGAMERDVGQLEAMAIELVERNQQLELELTEMRKAEEEHLNEILRLRDVISELEQAAPGPAAPTLPGSAASVGEAAAQAARLEADNRALLGERELLLAQAADAARADADLKVQLVRLEAENQLLLQQAGSAQGQPAQSEGTRRELMEVRGLLAREEEARSRAEEKVRQLEKQAEKAVANGSEQDHLAHISQLKQVVASQDTRFAKQLSELNVTAQRANELEETVEKMRQREAELVGRLEQLEGAEAEQRAFQLETMLGNMKSVEGDYVAQVSALQLEKQELVAQVAQLKHTEGACEQQAKRAMDLEGMLIREEDARRRAEERARQLEQAHTGSAQGQQSREEDLRFQLTQVQGRLAREEEARARAEEKAAVLEMAATERAAAEKTASAPAALTPPSLASEQLALASRVAELEAEVGGHVKRNSELNSVIQSVQDREKRIAQLEKALGAPNAPISPALSRNVQATPVSTGVLSSRSVPAVPPPVPQLGGSQSAGTGTGRLTARDAQPIAVSSRSSPPVPATQPAPASVEAVAGRSSVSAPVPATQPAPASVGAVAGSPSAATPPVKWPADGPPRQVSPMGRPRFVEQHGPQRTVSPMRVVQVFSTQGAPGRSSAVSPIRVLGTRDGPVREIRREVSPMQVRGRVTGGRESVRKPSPRGPAAGATEPFGGGGVVPVPRVEQPRVVQPRAGVMGAKEPVGGGVVQPRAGVMGAKEPVGGGVVQPRAGYPLEAPRPSGGESSAKHLPPWIETHTGNH